MAGKTTLSQPLSPHRQRKHDAMVRKILEIARTIMREQGVAALSMQELARRLDLRAPSLYNYFAGKMEIYDALFQEGFRLYGEKVWQNDQSIDTWQAQTLHAFESSLSFAKENPELYQLCFERPVPGFVPSDESMRVSIGLLERAYQEMESLIDTIDTDLPPRQVLDLLISMIHGITALHLANEPDKPIGEGRFGSLVPVAMSMLEKAWSKR